jgi:PAS domain S-box-containing protein
VSKTVLIVEDEGLVSLEIQENIERLGHTVLGVVDTGEEAITAAKKLHPDLILMDIHLKGTMDGTEAASTIRQSEDIPIVFLTAYSGDEILRKAMVTEPYAYLVKPIQEQQLASTLKMAWYRHTRDVVRERNFERFSSILKTLPHGVVVVDQELKVRYMNTRAKKLIGLTTNESWGRPLGEIVVLEDSGAAQALQTQASAVTKNGTAGTLGEHSLRSHLDEARNVVVDISPFNDRQGDNLGALLVLTELVVHDHVDSELDDLSEEEIHAREYYPPATQMGQLRSFLEIEIIRRALADESEDPYDRGFCDGQTAANKSVLQLFFGEEAVQEMEQIVASE